MALQQVGMQAVLSTSNTLIDDFLGYTRTAYNFSLPLNASVSTQWLAQRLQATMGVQMAVSGALDRFALLFWGEPQHKFIQLEELATTDTRLGSVTMVRVPLCLVVY